MASLLRPPRIKVPISRRLTGDATDSRVYTRFETLLYVVVVYFTHHSASFCVYPRPLPGYVEGASSFSFMIESQA